MSLVASYTDSEEEQEEEALGDTNESLNQVGEVSSNYFESTKVLNPFGVDTADIGNEESGSDSESKSDFKKKEIFKEKKRSDGVQLDNPFRYFGNPANVSAEDSVLRVEFREKEAQKTAVLERHVKMSQINATTTVNGKKICWSHRKGKCRFGHNCKFAHDSDADIIASNSGIISKKPDKNFQPISTDAVPAQFKKRNPFSLDKVDWSADKPVTLSSIAKLTGHDDKEKKKDSSEDESVDSSKPMGKRKRPGLSRDLVPGKKVMNMYYKNKSSSQSSNQKPN